MQKNKGAKAFNGEVCSVYRKDIGIMVFQAKGGDKMPSFHGNRQLKREL